MARPPTLLLTRPRAASDLFAHQVAQAIGPMPVVTSPLMEIGFLTFDAPSAPATLVFTSRNGVQAWARAKLPVDWPCWCVGPATAQAARALGFEPIESGGTVAHLLRDLSTAELSGNVIHVRGRHTRGDLTHALAKIGLNAQSLIAYEQNLRALSAAAQELIGSGAPVIAPLFSPRSAAQFAKFGPFGPQVDVIAISQAAAEQCIGARVAPSPDAIGMIAAISQRSMS